MKKTVFYTYLGTNGTITSPVHLEDIYYIRTIQLCAEDGYKLTKNNKDFYYSIRVPEEDVPNWKEVSGQV